MHEQLANSIKAIINCNTDELNTFLNIVKVKSFKRKELILKEGDTCKYLYFVNSGCIRYYYIVDGEEKTGQFFFENGWYTDMESFLTQLPSQQNIQAIEPCELVLIPKEKLYRLYDDMPIFERLGRLLLEQSFIGIHSKNKSLTTLTQEEQYLAIVEQRPKVIQRVPLQYIASYLGIKPESLSRIRKRNYKPKT